MNKLKTHGSMNFHSENINVPHLNNDRQLPDLIVVLPDELYFSNILKFLIQIENMDGYT